MQLAASSPTPRRLASEILERIFGSPGRWDFGVRFWDGTVLGRSDGAPFTLAFKDPSSVRAAFMPPVDLNPGRAFVERSIEIEGDIEAAIDVLLRGSSSIATASLPAIAMRILRLPAPARERHEGAVRLRGRLHSRRRDADAIGFHYDQPLAFYRAFLDPHLVYSCAYYDEGIESLEDAQTAKLDYILRKVRLAPGETLLDIGCGWGALVIRAAQRYGARAVGITLSKRQHEEAKRRIDAAGLAGRASVELLDYRELGKRQFDKIVSVGMVEHVGRERLPEYFRVADRALRRGGLFLNHGIADQSPGRRGWKASGFIGRYVFPDGELVSVSDANVAAEAAGFEIRDVENLREHYGRTLRAWLKNLEAHASDVVAATDERTFRIWRLYLAGSAQGFNSGRMALFQTLFAKPDAAGVTPIPATRRDLYR